MIRPITFVCALLAGASGLYLYTAKHRVQVLDHQIESTVRATQAARERTGVIKAEWTLLNDPERLGQLAAQFLPLKTVTPGQFTTVAELDNRLPPIPAPDAPSEQPSSDPQPEPVAEAPEPPSSHSPSPAQSATAPAAKPAPEPKNASEPKPASDKPQSAKVASAPPRPEHPPERKREPAKVASAPTETSPARVVTHSAIAQAPAPVAAPRPVPVAAYAPQASAGREASPRVVRNTPAEPTAPGTTSVLGMARRVLAPPVPVITAGGYNPGSVNGN